MRILFLAALLPLAACERPGDTITINADGGNVSGSVDRSTGEVKVDIPGFKGAISLPKVKFDAGNFDLNGVKLFPGSTIDGVNVSNAAGSEGVRVSFHSPAGPDAVRDWFRQRLAGAGYRLSADGTALTGTTQDDKPFRLDLQPDGDAARGTMTIGE